MGDTDRAAPSATASTKQKPLTAEQEKHKRLVSSFQAFSPTERKAALGKCAKAPKGDTECDQLAIVEAAQSSTERRALWLMMGAQDAVSTAAGAVDGDIGKRDDVRMFGLTINILFQPYSALAAMPRASLEDALTNPRNARGKVVQVVGVVVALKQDEGNRANHMAVMVTASEHGGEAGYALCNTPGKVEGIKVSQLGGEPVPGSVATFTGYFLQKLSGTNDLGERKWDVVLVGRFDGQAPTAKEAAAWDEAGLKSMGFNY